MYVAPPHGGAGSWKALLGRALEDAARERGWTTLRLETGPRQPEAIALYTGAGYDPTGRSAPRRRPDAVDSLFFGRAAAAGTRREPEPPYGHEGV